MEAGGTGAGRQHKAGSIKQAARIKGDGGSQQVAGCFRQRASRCGRAHQLTSLPACGCGSRDKWGAGALGKIQQEFRGSWPRGQQQDMHKEETLSSSQGRPKVWQGSSCASCV